MDVELYGICFEINVKICFVISITLTNDIWKPITQKAIMLTKSCINMTGFRKVSSFFTNLQHISSLCQYDDRGLAHLLHTACIRPIT